MQCVEDEVVEVVFRNAVKLTRPTGWNETITLNSDVILLDGRVISADKLNDRDLIAAVPGMAEYTEETIDMPLNLYPQTGINVLEFDHKITVAYIGGAMDAGVDQPAKDSIETGIAAQPANALVNASDFAPGAVVASGDSKVAADAVRYFWHCAFTGAKKTKAYYYRSNPLQFSATQNAGACARVLADAGSNCLQGAGQQGFVYCQPTGKRRSVDGRRTRWPSASITRNDDDTLSTHSRMRPTAVRPQACMA